MLVQGKESINGAIEGDTVAIRLFPKGQWKKAYDTFADNEDENDPKNEHSDLVGDVERSVNLPEPTMPINQANIVEWACSSNDKTPQPTGCIIGILKRARHRFCGLLEPRKCREAFKGQMELVYLFQWIKKS